MTCEPRASQDVDLDFWGRDSSQVGAGRIQNKPSVVMLPKCLSLVTVGLLSVRPSRKDEAHSVSVS